MLKLTGWGWVRYASLIIVLLRRLFCTNYCPTLRWYPGRPSPVPNARYSLVGTPEGHPLYQTQDITWLVHQKSVSCTDGVP